MALSQAAVVAADILPESGSISVAVHCPEYIPQAVWDRTAKDVAELYGLRELTVSATYPASELHRMEPGELMQLFVAQDSMARGVLAGAQWSWEGNELTVKLAANGKSILEEIIPKVTAEAS